MSRHTHPSAHPDDPHYVSRTGWLRAAVMGANDGIVSISSLIVGIAASGAGHSAVLLAGLAGLSAGALSMAAGEYVSVSSQADIERADISRETRALLEDPETELQELAEIYRGRGLSSETAMLVARESARLALVPRTTIVCTVHRHDCSPAPPRGRRSLTCHRSGVPLCAAGATLCADGPPAVATRLAHDRRRPARRT